MPFVLLPHTADIRLYVQAPTKTQLIAEAVRGIAEIMAPGQCQQLQECWQHNPLQRIIEVESVDFSALVVDFLSEVLYQMQVEHAVFCDVHCHLVEETRIKAVLKGCRLSEPFEEEIKAVTYHEAIVRRNEDQSWEVTLTLDI